VEFEVRHLQVKDIFSVARILRNCTQQAREALVKAAQPQATEDGQITVNVDRSALAMTFFEAAVDQEAELRKLFASLVSVKPEAFDSLPFDAPLDILATVMEQDDLNAFLSKALNLTKSVSIGR